MTEHFNDLEEDEQERLAILIEECGEVIHAAGKVLRHGYQSVNPNDKPGLQDTNRTKLALEIGHLEYAINRLLAMRDVLPETVNTAVWYKGISIGPYLHHQK